MTREFYVTADQDGRRVDRFLRTRYPQVPLGAIMKALRKGEVRLDAKKVQPDTRLSQGQLLQVPWDDVRAVTAGDCVKKNFPPAETIYRDGYAWIINKPAGLLTQPDAKGGDSLITRALAELDWSRDDFRPAAVQRLDRNTSGAVLVAMSGRSQRYLSQLIRERRIKKTYWAVVLGDMAESGKADFPLLKDPEANTVSVDEKGQDALTLYRRLGGGGKTSLMELELVTGRPHQARAHMSAMGHPIAGDVKYGGACRGVKRPLLHARSLVFPNDAELPEGIRGKEFTAELPKDMEVFFDALRFMQD